MQQALKFFSILALTIYLSGCTGLGGLNHKQIRMLKQQGFSYSAEEGWILALPEQLLFGINQADLNDNAIQSLAQLSSNLKKVNLNKLVIQGHTDNTGATAYNLTLSQQRAQHVADIFIQHQFNPQALKTAGFGSSKPIASNDTEDGRKQNRRVDIIIVP